MPKFISYLNFEVTTFLQTEVENMRFFVTSIIILKQLHVF